MRPGSVDSDYVLHGVRTVHSERPEYVTNSQLTTTTKDLSFTKRQSLDTQDEYRVHRHARTRSPSPGGNRMASSSSSIHNGSPRSRDHSPGSLRHSVSFERPQWSVGDGDGDGDGDEPELLRLADSMSRSDFAAEWYTRPVHLTQSLNSRELRNAVRAESRQSDRVASAAASARGASPSNHREQYPITELDEMARLYFPVTASAYRLEFGESPTSNSMAMSPPPRHLRAPKPHKWKVDGSVKHIAAVAAGRSSSQLLEKHPVDKLYSMVPEAPSLSASTVHVMSPYQMDLAKLRMERLRIEEDHLLEMKRQAEIERSRGPRPKWYESKKPDFHYEAHKNNELLANEGRWQELLEYRTDLKKASQVYQALNG